ncbi:MAG: hypothetical protein QW416_00755 [Candidatus Nitrosocaldaceae archaeon]
MIEVRIAIALIMLATAAFFDLKKRAVNDIVWMVFGSIGALLYIYDYNDYVFQTFMISITAAVAIALLAWYVRLFGGADALAIVALSILVPIYNNIPLPLIVIIVAAALSIIYSIMYNSIINTYHYLKKRRLFDEFDEPLYRRVIAFFFLHKMINIDRFVYIAEYDDGNSKRFRFKTSIDDVVIDYRDKYVSLSIPFLFYMLIALIMVYLYQIHYLWML